MRIFSTLKKAKGSSDSFEQDKVLIFSVIPFVWQLKIMPILDNPCIPLHQLNKEW